MKNKILNGVIISVIALCLAPFSNWVGNSAFSFFSTPKELKETNERITRDSSLLKFRWMMRSQSNVIINLEEQNDKINHKLKIK